MDLGVDLGGAARLAEDATGKTVALSAAVEDAALASRDLASAVDGVPAVAELVDAILGDWGLELRGAAGQAADSAHRLREGLAAFAGVDQELAVEADQAVVTAPYPAPSVRGLTP